MDQQTHNRMVELFNKIIALEKTVEEQREEINYLRMCFDVLRDKAHAIAVMVGDFQDRPAGSLRERMTGMEERIVENNFREEIFEHFKLEDHSAASKLPLRAAFEQEAQRLEAMMKEE